jgi:hypothetical protein
VSGTNSRAREIADQVRVMRTARVRDRARDASTDDAETIVSRWLYTT